MVGSDFASVHVFEMIVHILNSSTKRTEIESLFLSPVPEMLFLLFLCIAS